MKNIKPLFIAFVLICSSAIGQTVRQKRAEGLYNNFSFVKAIKHYQKLIDKDDNKGYALRKLGDTYIMLRMPEKALSIYKQVVQQPNVPSKYYYYYAQVLRATGDYNESKVWMKKYKEQGNDDDLRIKEFFKDGDLASGIFNSFQTHTLSELNINTEFNEFGAVEFDDKLYFASSRDEGVSVKRLYSWDEQPLLDVYVTSKENGSVATTTRIEGDVNTIYHDGSVTFNPKGNKMYFSRSNYFQNKKIKDSKGTMQVGIYTAELIDGNWTNIKSTNLNNAKYLVYNPSLSKDGKKLYFASDMPKGYGGTDIYVSTVSSNGTLGAPKNLGDIVNTEGNETFPFIHDKDETLYFSSDGHVGLGLMDVFASVRDENNEIVNVINLGEPINSKKDDIAYYLSEDSLKGYVSSNRKGGLGGDDIYAFARAKPIPPIPPLTLKGQVFNDVNNEPVAGAKVVLTRKNGEEIAYFTTREDGSFEHLIDRDEDFVLNVSKEKYQDAEKDFNSFGLEKEEELVVDLNIGLKPIEDVVLLANLDKIYFDLNKSFIRPDAAIELNKVVDLMVKEYPGMVIRLESHTDSRASNAYNSALSKRRAKSTYDYIISNGVDASRITSHEGFGETQLRNKCSNNVKCSEKEHQLNRRTEFIIIKMK
ncbi:MAG: flagellar motor protein MotB [Lutibacter sp.]|nr:MAG: flagellar motor protein MotB [Lutibacter sp.]